MFNPETFDRALKIKGYGSYRKTIPFSRIQNVKTVQGETVLKVKPTIITNLREYIDFIENIKTSYTNPVFFRGQTNADYLLTPTSLRINPQNEHIMLEAFSRKFFDELNRCHSSMEKLIVMQHFHLPTRCLDITESPLVALYFACSHMKKFRTRIVKSEEEDWGEIILFREPDSEDRRPEKLKSIESSNISVIANTAYMEDDFSLWHLGVRWKKDVDIGHDEQYIDLINIVRQSYIVRVPHNNIRIKNQQGAFIMVNANMAYIDAHENERNKLTKDILNGSIKTFNQFLKDNKELCDTKPWMFRFYKIKPYSTDNELSIFQTDPFDLRRLLYKEKGIQQIVLVPPENKQEIIEELRKLNISEDFVYPDMDNVANEIREQINVE
ncbi:MAG: FRG domain-containing protein [Spirochaetaceae bacterium]|nr:FRG domain-containing protein [Spirochaetaceae bacterium]